MWHGQDNSQFKDIKKRGVLYMNKIEKENLRKFLEYLQDKVEKCYKKETEIAIEEFLKDIK